MTTQHPIELILLRQLASFLDMPVFVIDADGRLLYYNEPAEPLLGRRFDEIGPLEMDEWLTAFRPSDEHGRMLGSAEIPVLVALRDRRPIHGGLWISGLDGVRRGISVTAIPLTGQGGHFLGAVAFFWIQPAS